MKIIRLISQEFFYALTGALIVFSAMELFWDRIVLSYINLNWVLILWALNAILLLALTQQKND